MPAEILDYILQVKNTLQHTCGLIDYYKPEPGLKIYRHVHPFFHFTPEPQQRIQIKMLLV